MPALPRSPIPGDVAAELDRAVRRWHQMPVDRAVAACPGVHALLAELAGEPVPDLGPAPIPDQLRVVVHDACATAEVPDLAARLVSLRLSWSSTTKAPDHDGRGPSARRGIS